MTDLSGVLAALAGHGGDVVFGGQILADTIVRAAEALPDKEVKSVHTIFARGASRDAPLEYDVDEMHSGRAFGSVTVTLRQGDRLCARSLVLLHAPDADLIQFAVEPPKIAAPDDLPERGNSPAWSVRYAADIDIGDPDAIGPPELDVWTRFPDAPSDVTSSQALLGYASDGFLIATAMRPHAGVGQSLAHKTIATTVLTQTLSFHAPFDASQWLLLAHESPSAGRGRSYGRANVFNEDGRLVASFVQDNMIRA